MGYRVVVDFDLCESNARCMEAAPEVFEVRDDDFLYVLDETPPDELRAEGRGGRAALPEGGHHRRRRVTAGDGPAARIVVVGASLAGLRAAEELRTAGFDGTITVVGDEAHAPYDRPPLSKQVLAGDWALERIALTARAPTAGSTRSTSTGGSATRAAGLDLGAARVVLADGDVLAFDGLVIATGATPRDAAGHRGARPGSTRCARSTTAWPCGPTSTPAPAGSWSWGPGSSAPRWRRPAGARAATSRSSRRCRCRSAGRSATRWARCMGELHRDHGVDLRLGVGVAGFEGGDRVERVRLADGSAVDGRPGGRGHRRGAQHRLARGLGPGARRRRGVRRHHARRARASWPPATWPAGPATASAS